MPLHDVSQQGAEAIDATMAAAVTMVNANTFYDGPSAVFPPGQWLIFWKTNVQVILTTSQSYWWTGKLWDGSTVYDEQEVTTGNVTANFSGWNFGITGFAVVTLAVATTLKISIAPGRGSSTSQINVNVTDNSPSTKTATRLSGIKIA
jgi:hypothetical protein